MKTKIVLSFILLLAGCTDNQRARNFGGTATENLPAGQKLAAAAWKQDDLWLLTRPMRPDETPETWSLRESSSFGIVQGNVIIVESR